MAEEQKNEAQIPQPPASASLSNVPPPPPEVKVRTMRTDLESIMESGGGLPQFQTVRLNVAEVGRGAKARGRNRLFLVLVVVAAVALLGVIIYLAYKIFLPQLNTRVNTPNAAAVPEAAAPFLPSVSLPAPRQPTSTQNPAPAQVSSHHSLFQIPADQFLRFVAPSTSTTNAAELETFNQKLSALLKTASSTSAIIEVEVDVESGRNLTVSEIWSAAGTDVIDPTVISAHFNSDPTYFIYRDKNGFWPGYVLILKSGENWLFVKPKTASLENSEKVQNFFLAKVGAPDPRGFQDSVWNGNPIRALSFSSPTSTFAYGWFKNYLILSTSLDGLKEALARLVIKT